MFLYKIDKNLDFVNYSRDNLVMCNGCIDKSYVDWYNSKVRYRDIEKMYEYSGYKIPPEDFFEDKVLD